jgi:putative peptidoglycan lipid II flippase
MRLRIAPFDRDFLRYLALAAPLMLGVTLMTVDEWYDRWFGALLAEGTVAHLLYARRLMQMPVAVVGQAIATAALPLLARLWSEEQREQLDRVLLDTLRVGLGLALLAAAAVVALAEPLVEVVYQRGQFTADDALRVTSLLSVFALGVPAWVTQQIAVRAFFARGDMWRPMLLGTAVALGAAPLYIALGPRYGAEGLAAAGAIAMSINAVLTLLLARRLHGAPRLGVLLAAGVRTAVVAAPALLVGVWLQSGGPGAAGALRDLLVGGAGFAAVALGGISVIGDAPLRQGLSQRLQRLAGRAGSGK